MVHFLRAVVGLNEAAQGQGSEQSQAHSRSERTLATRLGPRPLRLLPSAPGSAPLGSASTLAGHCWCTGPLCTGSSLLLARGLSLTAFKPRMSSLCHLSHPQPPPPTPWLCVLRECKTILTLF